MCLTKAQYLEYINKFCSQQQQIEIPIFKMGKEYEQKKIPKRKIKFQSQNYLEIQIYNNGQKI